jgi:hypothetical protein
MVPILSLVLPIVISAVLVFVASSIIHMVLPYHRSDMRMIPAGKEDEVLEALRRINVPPGQYGAPHPGSMAGMKDPAFVAKMTKGPQVLMTVSPGGPASMGTSLTLWFVYILVVNIFAAYVTGRAVGPGADYLTVFRFIGTTAFMSYSLGLMQNSIWYRRPWSITAKSVFDGLVYALLTAGVFGSMWPR